MEKLKAPRFALTSLLILLILLISFTVLHAQNDPVSKPSNDELTIGSMAPIFVLKDLNGVKHDLSTHRGKTPIVISFWSIYCDSCVDEMLSLQKLEDKYNGDELVILAVNEDIRVDEERIRRFLARLEKFRGKITYPLLFDKNSEVFNSYGGTFLPTLLLLDKEGKIAAYFHGFDPEEEHDLLATIEGLVGGEESDTLKALLKPVERKETITVTGEALMCGFFDINGWRKSFTGDDSFDQELELTRDLSRRDATRRAVVESLRILGVQLFANEPRSNCVDYAGIHLDRDPFDTDDPLSNFMNIIGYSDYFETLEEQEMLIDNVYYNSRTVRVSIESFTEELLSQGYILEPMRIEFTFVNMSQLDLKEFLLDLLKQSKFIGQFENPVFTAHSTSQVFEVYTSSQGFADEILGMNFGDLQVFVEQVTPGSLELEVWK